MNGLSGETLLIYGRVLIIFAFLASIIAFVVFKIMFSQLKKRLDEEYGEEQG